MAHDYAGIAATNDVKTVDGAEIKSYRQANEFLGDEQERELASNVRLRRERISGHDAINVVLYRTVVVTYYDDEMFSVNNGGYNTPTTSTRVNQFTPDNYFFFHDKKKLATYEHSPAEGILFEGILFPTTKEDQ